MHTANLAPSQTSSFWLRAGRLAWIVATVLLLAIFVAGLPARFEELRQVCATEACVVLALTPPEAEVLAELGFSMEAYAGYHAGIEIAVSGVFVLLGLLLFWRRSDDWFVLLVSFAFVSFGLNFMVEADKAFISLYPALTPLHEFSTALISLPFVLLFYLFPDGRYVPRWTRLATALLLGLALFDPLFIALGLRIPSGAFSLILLIAILISLLLGIGAQIYRYRFVSDAVQRQQTKWVIVGLASLLVPILVWTIFVEVNPPAHGLPRLIFNTIGFAFVLPFFYLFPLSFFVSITRYRLWDIDLIIRRTLVYSLLTGLLLLIYFGSVVAMQALVQAVTGQAGTSPVAIILSTLIVAAVFSPLRRRIQGAIDRRFYRRKYDAAQMLSRFARTARNEVELDTLTAELLQVVRETMQPEQVGLWLRKP